jgi:Protein of unknown function (DUF3153)
MLNSGLRWVGGFACLFLMTGCVHYRLGIAFDWLGHGSIEQILQLDPALTQAGGIQMQDLTKQLSLRTKELGGSTLRLDDELHLMIPFTNSEELSQKINQFLGQPLTNALSITPSAQTKIAPPTISAPTQKTTASTTTHSPQPFRIETENHWLWTEYKVIADLDLRNPLHASGSEAFLSAIGVVNLEFALTTPLMASSSNASEQDGNTLIWHLQLEQVNHLEAGFNLPNWQLFLVLPLGGAIFLFWKSKKVSV